MILTIGTVDHPRTISQWWDGLEWQSYETPKNIFQLGDGCSQSGMIDNAACLMHSVHYSMFDSLWMGDLYKVAGHVKTEIQTGISNEFYNAVDMVSSWIF